jgi:hypothetical protein
MYSISLIHSSVVGHLGCFCSLAIMKSAMMNISVQVSLLYPDLTFLWVDTQKRYHRIIWQVYLSFLSKFIYSFFYLEKLFLLNQKG